MARAITLARLSHRAEKILSALVRPTSAREEARECTPRLSAISHNCVRASVHYERRRSFRFPEAERERSAIRSSVDDLRISTALPRRRKRSRAALKRARSLKRTDRGTTSAFRLVIRGTFLSFIPTRSVCSVAHLFQGKAERAGRSRSLL